jgi:hypothetical protein
MRLTVGAPCLSLFAVDHCGTITGKPETEALLGKKGRLS